MVFGDFSGKSSNFSGVLGINLLQNNLIYVSLWSYDSLGTYKHIFVGKKEFRQIFGSWQPREVRGHPEEMSKEC